MSTQNDTSQVGLTGEAVDEEGLGSEDGDADDTAAQEKLVDPEQVEPTGERENTSGSGSSQGKSSESGGELTKWGLEEDPHPRNTRRDQPNGELKRDARMDIDSDGDAGEQRQLFPDVEDDQQTLTGERAGNQCLFDQ